LNILSFTSSFYILYSLFAIQNLFTLSLLVFTEIHGMKTLILVRHAKSSWDSFDIQDFDRPLNDRGKKDAPDMAARLKEKHLSIDALVSSPARRAKKTARIFAEGLKKDKDDIIFIDRLYGADVPTLTQVISSLEDKYDAVALFAHNPGLTDFANTLTTVRIDNMPTCSLFAVQASVNKWSQFAAAEKSFLFFDYPKNPLGHLD
jgi:phosphohistidine phosphatase